MVESFSPYTFNASPSLSFCVDSSLSASPGFSAVVWYYCPKGIHFSRVDLILMIDICLSPVSVSCMYLCIVLFCLVHDRPLLFTITLVF
jgi:hypothetical protein